MCIANPNWLLNCKLEQIRKVHLIYSFIQWEQIEQIKKEIKAIIYLHCTYPFSIFLFSSFHYISIKRKLVITN